MDEIIPVIKNNKTFTSFHFYNVFLVDLARAYQKGGRIKGFQLFENGDERVYDSKYRIDPVSIPLLLNVFEQLKKYHKEPLYLYLNKNNATEPALAFIDRAHFFKVSGKNKNPSFPKGREIIEFNEDYLGDYKVKSPRDEHKVRAYSLDDNDLSHNLELIEGLETKRDALISFYTYKVDEHFSALLYDNFNTAPLRNLFIDILAELITNGVLHSKSETYALMFVDSFNTKISISDNGIGLTKSMQNKEDTPFYKPNSLLDELKLNKLIISLDKPSETSLLIIFETLYYSSLKDREGLFDLMINAVLNSKGYFRLHTDNCQVFISNRLMTQLVELQKIRINIFRTHNDLALEKISNVQFNQIMENQVQAMKNQFVRFFNACVISYNADFKYSSLRFFDVKFKGVHIEVEIPFD